jgi:hypothetical protein
MNEFRDGYWASANPVNGTIHLNPIVFKSSLKTIYESYSKRVRLGLYPEGTDWRGIIAHEVGHIIDGILTKSRYNRNWNYTDFTKNTSYEIRTQLIDKLTLKGDNINKGLSYNAQSNAAEFFADAVNEFLICDNPRRIASAVKVLVDYYLGGMF